MVQRAKLSVSGLNIRIVDRDKRDYIALFNLLFELREAVRVYGTEHLMMTSFGRTTSSAFIKFGGVIGKFVDIPKDSDWLDTDTLKRAKEEQLDEIVIPKNLKPNYESFRFALFEQDHVVAFEVYADKKGISPRSVLKWLKVLALSRAVTEQFGEIQVDLIPDYDLLEQILESDSLKMISMDIRMPNPDGLDHAKYEEIAAKLDELNAEEETLTYKARGGHTLTLDDDTKAIAKVAAENGKVTARIQENGLTVPVSTSKHPIEIREVYDSEEHPSEPIFRRLAVALWQAVRRNRNPQDAQQG
jgi:hypothetical protein